MNHQKSSYPTMILRWLARIGSLACIGIITAFLFGGGEAIPSVTDLGRMIFFPGLVVCGMALGWWNEFLGGVTTAVGLGGFYLAHFISAGHVNIGPYFLLFSLPGLLYLLVWAGDRFAGKVHSGRPAENEASLG